MKIHQNMNLFASLLVESLAFNVCCGDHDDDAAPMEPTLYTRPGGLDAISAVTDKFLTNVASTKNKGSLRGSCSKPGTLSIAAQ